MQNKPNLPVSQMNVSYVKIKNYEQRTMDNEPIKQTQSKPISIFVRRSLRHQVSFVIRDFWFPVAGQESKHSGIFARLRAGNFLSKLFQSANSKSLKSKPGATVVPSRANLPRFFKRHPCQVFRGTIT